MRFSKLRLFLFLTTIIISTLFINCSKEDSPTEPNNNAPVATINTPLDNAIYFKSDTILFTATATDAEDGALTDSSLVWSSHINGQIGIGDSLLYSSLYENTHQIFLTATDSKGDTDIDTITLTIQANLPIVTIMSPADSSTFSFGDTITFIGTAIDREDGVLTGGSLVWTSDKDGQIGTGTSFNTNTLSNNHHTITLTATDSHRNVGIKTISVTIHAPITFEKLFGGIDNQYGYSCAVTSNGEYIITGLMHNKLYVIKTDKNGNLLWEKIIGSSNISIGYSVIETSDKNYVIIGSSNEPVYADIYLIKIDIDGNLLWEKTFGDTSNDIGYSVCETSDGGLILTGYKTIPRTSITMYLIKTDAEGNLLWEKNYAPSNEAYGYSVSKTSDGNYVITGYYFPPNTNNPVVYLLKIDNSGTIVWERFYEDANINVGYSVFETTDGGYLITGRFHTSTSSFNVTLIKTDNIGNLVWEKSFGGAGIENGKSAHETSDGGYVVIGSTNSIGVGESDVYLFKTDNNGNLLWEKTYGYVNNDYGESVQVTSDSGFVMIGSTESFGTDGFDVYLIKTDSEGNVY